MIRIFHKEVKFCEECPNFPTQCRPPFTKDRSRSIPPKWCPLPKSSLGLNNVKVTDALVLVEEYVYDQCKLNHEDFVANSADKSRGTSLSD